jgi:hypothetical protein
MPEGEMTGRKSTSSSSSSSGTSPSAGAEAQLAWEREKFDFEREIRTREVDIREREVRQQQKWSPLIIAIFTAAAAGVANLAVTYVNGRNDAEVEAVKGEQALVLEAIKTGGDVAKAEENLRFLARSGLLSERGAKISRALDEGNRPSLPAAASGVGGGNNASAGVGGGNSAFGTNQPPPSRAEMISSCLNRLHLRIPGESPTSQITRLYIRAFQKQHGLPQTGLYDSSTQQHAFAKCGIAETD